MDTLAVGIGGGKLAIRFGGRPYPGAAQARAVARYAGTGRTDRYGGTDSGDNGLLVNGVIAIE